MPTTPRTFGNYYLLERIASGGMGEVYAAVARAPQGFGKLCALKTILPSHRGGRSDFAGRFRDEGRLVISMNHPNVVSVYEMGRVAEEFYLAMELVEGKDLGQLLTRCWRAQRLLPIPTVLYLVRELLSALDYCHRHTDEHGAHLGLIHRDVSPANVLVSYDGFVKLADFGLAKSHRKLIHTQPQVVLGKPGYMAPERLLGTAVDHRTDIFSAGILLFELLTCERYAPAREPELYLKELVRRQKTPPSALRPDVPPAVDDLVARAVAMDSRARFGSAEEFADALQRVLVQIDPLYGPRQLARQVMGTLFHPTQERRRVQALLNTPELRRLQSQEVPVAEHRESESTRRRIDLERGGQQDLVDEAARLREASLRRAEVGRGTDPFDVTTESRPIAVKDGDLVEVPQACVQQRGRPGFGPRSSSALRTIAAMPPLSIREASAEWRVPSGALSRRDT